MEDTDNYAKHSCKDVDIKNKRKSNSWFYVVWTNVGQGNSAMQELFL